MAARVNAKGNASPAFVVIAVVLLIAIVGWLAYANLFAPPKPPPMTQAQQQTVDKYDALAKKSHGDINQLSPEERDQFMQATGGHGEQILQSIAKQKGY